MPTESPHEKKSFKVKPNTGLRSEHLDLVQEALKRALAIATSKWADPNERCAAITMALAIIACPTRVNFRIWAIDGSIQTRFESLKVTLPQSGRFLWSIIFSETDASGSKNYFQFANLAESYADHDRNMACLKHLNTYLKDHLGPTEKAAVLGLAWAHLQRREISTWFSLGGSASGLHLECGSLGIGIRVVSKTIAEARYPGLQTATGIIST